MRFNDSQIGCAKYNSHLAYRFLTSKESGNMMFRTFVLFQSSKAYIY